MKKFQVVMGLLMPPLLWLSTQLLTKQIEIYHIDLVITYVEIVCFIAGGTLNLILFTWLMSSTRLQDKTHYVLAQVISLQGMLTFYSYAFLTYKWTMTTQATKELDVLLDTLYGIVNLNMIAYGIITAQFISVMIFNRSIIPFVTISKKKPFGHYLKIQGLVTDAQLQKAYELQKADEGIKDDTSERE